MAPSGTPPPRVHRHAQLLDDLQLVRAFSSSCTRIGTNRSPVSNRASAGPTSPIVATRIVSERPSVETSRRASRSVWRRIRSSGRSSDGLRDDVGDERNAPHLRRELLGDVGVTVSVIGTGHVEGDRRATVVIDEPVAQIRDVLELAADRELELALGRSNALRFRRVVDVDRRAADLLRRPSEPVRRRRRRSRSPAPAHLRTISSVTARCRRAAIPAAARWRGASVRCPASAESPSTAG